MICFFCNLSVRTILFNWIIVIVLWTSYNGDLLNCIVGVSKWLQIGASTDTQIQEVHPRGNCDVVIGVLSARQNFEQRQTIRDTWWPKLKTSCDQLHRIEAWFIVGSEACPHHPLDRIDEYDCVPWKLDREIGTVISGLHLLSSVKYYEFTTNLNPKKTVKVYSGLKFKVNHAIVVNKLGLIKYCFSEDITWESRIVTIWDAAKQEIVTEVVIGRDDLFNKTVESAGYMYRAIESILLPKGFDGIIMTADNFNRYNVDQDEPRLHFDIAGGIIATTHFITDDGELNDLDKSSLVSVSFGYVVYDIDRLTNYVIEQDQRQIEWNLKLDIEKKRLQEEQDVNADLVFVDVIDVYRNLPVKLLAFYEWVTKSYNFSFVIKMDDDTLLDIEEIMTSLPSTTLWSWWGHFRLNWGVERHGKWSETTYKSISYPPFACGAAYAITTDLASWLAYNRPNLHPFQGEDVSMGIWLAPLNPNIIHDTRWSCSNECLQTKLAKSFSRGQLLPSNMIAAWTTLRVCQNACQCNDQSYI